MLNWTDLFFALLLSGIACWKGETVQRKHGPSVCSLFFPVPLFQCLGTWVPALRCQTHFETDLSQLVSCTRSTDLAVPDTHNPVRLPHSHVSSIPSPSIFSSLPFILAGLSVRTLLFFFDSGIKVGMAICTDTVANRPPWHAEAGTEPRWLPVLSRDGRVPCSARNIRSHLATGRAWQPALSLANHSQVSLPRVAPSRSRLGWWIGLRPARSCTPARMICWSCFE